MKQKIRQEMILKRKSLDRIIKKKYDQSLREKILADQDFIQAKVVAFYMPMADEVDILDVYQTNKTFLIPRVDKDGMVFVIYDKNIKLKKTKFGTLEPSKALDIYDKNIDYMIIPALALSKDLNRIGYGKGYYDQYIKNNRPTKIVGTIYPFQEIEFEAKDFDQKIDHYYIGEL